MLLTLLAFELHAAGSNKFGKLGLSLDPTVNTTVSAFTQMQTDLDFDNVNMGTNHVTAITKDHKLYMWGRSIQNSFLSHPDGNHMYPKEITYFTENHIEVLNGDAGAFHTGIVASNGMAYLFGENSGGQLGKSEDVLKQTNSTPVIITPDDLDGSSAVQIAVEFETTLIVTAKGGVFVSGACRNGICGPIIESVNKFTKIPLDFNVKRAFIGNESIYLESDKGEMYATGENLWHQLCLPEKKNYTEFTKIDGLKAIKSVSVGDKHTIFVTINNTVLGCGYGTTCAFNNTDRNLLYKSPTQFIEGTVDSAACTSGGTLYTRNGSLYATGEQYKGELGYNDGRDLHSNFVPIYFDKDINTIVGFGDYTFALGYSEVLKTGMAWWIILLIVVAALVVLAVVAWAVWYFFVAKRKAQTAVVRPNMMQANANAMI